MKELKIIIITVLLMLSMLILMGAVGTHTLVGKYKPVEIRASGRAYLFSFDTTTGIVEEINIQKFQDAYYNRTK